MVLPVRTEKGRLLRRFENWFPKGKMDVGGDTEYVARLKNSGNNKKGKKIGGLRQDSCPRKGKKGAWEKVAAVGVHQKNLRKLLRHADKPDVKKSRKSFCANRH